MSYLDYATITDNPGLAYQAETEAKLLTNLKANLDGIHKAALTTADNIGDYDRRTAAIQVASTLCDAMADLQDAINDAMAEADRHGG